MDHVSTMEIRWLKSFLMVAEEMHFSRAAKRLKLAQPALTAQIRQLEEELGKPLFDRSNRMRGLTAAGRALVPEARAILERAGGLKDLARRAESGGEGPLRVGLIPPAATRHIADIFASFGRRMPNVSVSVRMGHQDVLMALLVPGEVDLVLGRPEKPPAGSAIQEKQLASEIQGIVLRDDDPIAGANPIPVAKLNGRGILLLRDNLHFGQLLLEHCARHGVEVFARHEAEDFQALQWMVAAGLGIAPMSCELPPPPGLVLRPIRPPLPRLGIFALWNRISTPPVVSRWLDFVRKEF